MQKIISLFQRNYDGDRLVRDEVVPGAEWVLAGEGVATRKLDGTCCMMRGRQLYKRYDAKAGKTPPPGFEPAQEPDSVTGHWPGWLPVGDGPEDRWHREALENFHPLGLSGRGETYELVGPKIQGNPEGFTRHMLLRHGDQVLLDGPRTFDGLRSFFERAYQNEVHPLEGIVWYHPDGRMVKIKAKDFGIKRGLVVNQVPGQRFYAWDELTERAREGRREQARHLLAKFVLIAK